MSQITIYGADWCSMTIQTRRHLDRLHVPYQFIDIDQDRQAASWVAEQNGGKEKKPTLDIDGEILSEPTNQELDRVLQNKGLLA